MSAPDASTAATTAATPATAPTSAPVTAAPAPAAAAPAPVAARPYNPNANLSQLDPTASLPDENENARLSAELDHNVKNMLATKMENERKTQKFGTLLAQKAKLMEEESRKLAYVRSELQKLDQSFSRNIDMIRTEIEGVGREVNSLQKEFDYKEREYLECRKALAKVKQRKLLLNSHLDYIIMTNENEKASKLQELERTLGLAPSSSPPPAGGVAYALPDANSVALQAKQAIQAASVPPPAVNAPSSGPSPAVLAAAAENARKHAAANAANAIDKDHPGLKLDVLAPPGFGGFDATEAENNNHNNHNHLPQIHQQQQQQTQQQSNYSGTNPFGPPTPTDSQSSAPQQQPQQIPNGPSPASIAASRHVSMPPRSATSASSLSTSNPFASSQQAQQPQQQQQAPRSASSALSIANKKSGTPLSFTSDGTFAGFAD